MTPATPARQPQHCDHECVCMGYCNRNEMFTDDPCTKTPCPHDTRPHTSPPAPEHGRWRDAENPEMVHTPQQHTECYLGGYADGAKAAREQVLDELLLWCNDNWHGAFIVQYEKQLTEQVVDLVRLKAMIKSLRAPQEQS